MSNASAAGAALGDAMRADRPFGGPASGAVLLTDASGVGEARRAALALASRTGLGETEQGALAIVATELATNIVRHARTGTLLVRALDGLGNAGVEVLALDRGPGIADLAAAMRDGFSTRGTSGNGLGAVRRMATEFDAMSSGATGTAIVARVWAGGRRGSIAEGVVCVPMHGETACGDAWTIIRQAGRTLVVMADGLGHGPDAARAADAFMAVVREHPDSSPAELVRAGDGPLRATRGAAVAVAAIVPDDSVVHYAGVGNISGEIISPEGARAMASHNGTVGGIARRVQEFTYPWPRAGRMVLHSDGLSARWRVDGYPGLIGRDAALIAGVLYRDFARGRDDTTILVVRDDATDRARAA